MQFIGNQRIKKDPILGTSAVCGRSEGVASGDSGVAVDTTSTAARQGEALGVTQRLALTGVGTGGLLSGSP